MQNQVLFEVLDGIVCVFACVIVKYFPSRRYLLEIECCLEE
jgi:hypothetical protein